MTDWIEHTGDTCPVDPETVVEVKLRDGYIRPEDKAGDMDWGSFLPSGFPHPLDVTHYRITTPATPPEPEMGRTTYALPEGAKLSDWIPHDGGECPVSGSTLVHVDIPGINLVPAPAAGFPWQRVKRYCTVDIKPPPEPEEDQAYLEEMRRQANREHSAYKRGFEAGQASPEPDFVTLRLECLKLAVNDHFYEAGDPDYEQVADRFLRYVLNGLEKEAGMSNAG